MASRGRPLEGCDEALLANDGREYMMGIDEAGRGPLLGAMVYGSAFCAVDDEDKLRGMGFNDSKQLTEAKREQLWDQIQTCGFIGWRIRVLEAKEISEGMLRRHNKYNLNAMSHDAAIGLVQGVLASGVNLRFLYVDTVGDPQRYQAKLADLFPSLRVVVEKKADATYPVVSAASICAKVTGAMFLRINDARARPPPRLGFGASASAEPAAGGGARVLACRANAQPPPT